MIWYDKCCSKKFITQPIRPWFTFLGRHQRLYMFFCVPIFVCFCLGANYQCLTLFQYRSSKSDLYSNIGPVRLDYIQILHCYTETELVLTNTYTKSRIQTDDNKNMVLKVRLSEKKLSLQINQLTKVIHTLFMLYRYIKYVPWYLSFINQILPFRSSFMNLL